MEPIDTKCPKCGEPLKIDPSQKEVTCDSCHAVLLIDGEVLRVKDEDGEKTADKPAAQKTVAQIAAEERAAQEAERKRIQEEAKARLAEREKLEKGDDPSAKLPNGMYKERTLQSCLQGGLLLVFLCGLGVFSYIVSMIPAGLFGVAVAKDSTSSQSIYDIQNIVQTVLGTVIFVFGGWMLSKKVGEADALYAFQNKQDRKMDKRYLLLSVCLAVIVYFILVAVINLDFFSGPIRYLSVFYSRQPRRINEGLKISMGYRCLGALTVLAIVVPFIVVGVFKGFRSKMAALEEEEVEEKKRAEEKAKEEAEEAEKEAARAAEREAEREARRQERERLK